MNSSSISKGLSSFAKEISSSCLLFSTDDLPEAFQQAMLHNKWFSKENILAAMNHWAESLSDCEAVEKWLEHYPEPTQSPKKILLVLPGNLPAVGFHDVLCTLLSGHRAEIKLSSDDRFLIPWMLERLSKAIPEWKDRYQFHEGLIKDFDAVIATGSNQSAKTFESYFAEKPSIIRHSRSSVAIIHSDDSDEALQKLASDVFLYFGLGCRNVSLIMMPSDFDKDRLFTAFKSWHMLGFHNAFANNYDYYKGYFTLMKEELLDGGFYLLRSNDSLHAPVAVINIMSYKKLDEVMAFVVANSDNIQCVVSSKPLLPETILPGQAQFPPVSEYADGVDTMEFLLAM